MKKSNDNISVYFHGLSLLYCATGFQGELWKGFKSGKSIMGRELDKEFMIRVGGQEEGRWQCRQVLAFGWYLVMKSKDEIGCPQTPQHWYMLFCIQNELIYQVVNYLIPAPPTFSPQLTCYVQGSDKAPSSPVSHSISFLTLPCPTYLSHPYSTLLPTTF